jgi:large subunit ribosomal protein L9
MMEIILLERIANLGQMGDLVTVKPGYARNFLLPQGKALRATKANRERFDNDRAQLEAENLNRKGEAEKIAEKMNDLSVSLIRAASEMGQLYGSASARDISDVISESGFTVNRNQIDLNTAIKTLGLFPVRVVLHPEVAVEVTVNIARSADEAAEQIKLGRAIVSDVAERERMEAAEAAKAAEQRMADFEAEEVQDTTGSDVSAETDALTEAPTEAGDQADAGDASPDETSA